MIDIFQGLKIDLQLQRPRMIAFLRIRLRPVQAVPADSVLVLASSFLCLEALVQTLPRVRSNPSSFNVAKQSANQSLKPFHQRWTSLFGTDGRCRRLVTGNSLMATCLSRISLIMASNSFEDVVWSNLFFRSASVTVGLFVSWMSGSRGRSTISQISLGIDQDGTARRAFPFASSFVMRLRRNFI